MATSLAEKTMKAMIFAAGRGERMGNLTKEIPKPLLTVKGKPLIAYTLENLRKAGIKDVIINVAYLGHQIEQALGEGDDYGLHIKYSFEPYPLETAGAIVFASQLIGEEPFLLTNADVWTDYPYQQLIEKKLSPDVLGHLVMVKNPDHNAVGDFDLESNGYLSCSEKAAADNEKVTFSGISLINPSLVLNYKNKREKFPLVEVFKDAMEQKALTGELFQGNWQDIGTPERLAAIQNI